MRIEDSYPTPIHGISTQPARDRQVGLGSEQVNMYADKITKLTRRNSTEIHRNNIVVTDDVRHETFTINNQEWDLYFYGTTGQVQGFVSGIPAQITGTLSPYVGAPNDLIFSQIDNQIIVTNPDRVVGSEFVNEYGIEQFAAHFNFVKAAHIGENIEATIKTDSYEYSIKLLVPTLTDFANADQLTGTSFLAELFYDVFRTGTVTPALVPFVTLSPDLVASGGIGNDGEVGISRRGSTLAIVTDPSNSTYYLSTQSDTNSLIAINSVRDDIEGLPKYAWPNVVVKIQPSTQTEQDTFYLQSVQVEGEAPTTDAMVEVVWTETTVRDEDNTLNNMPLVMTMTGFIDIDISEGDWNYREVGDNVTCPPPEFVGQRIKAVEYYQNRLLFTHGSTISTSRTDEFRNFWKKSAIGLLQTDPVSVRPSKSTSGDITHIITHNKNLVVFCKNSQQFALSNDINLTPQTVSMPLITAYEYDGTTQPISIGNSIYFAIEQNGSVGLAEYTGLANTSQDKATPISEHATGYMQGTVKEIVGNATKGVMFVLLNEVTDKVYIHKLSKGLDGGVTQSSWSHWDFSNIPDIEIVNIQMVAQTLKITYKDTSNMKVTTLNMPIDIDVAKRNEEIYLDQRMVLESVNGQNFTIKDQLTNTVFPEDFIVVGLDGTYLDKQILNDMYTNNTTLLNFTESISGGQPAEIYIGNKFTSLYSPTEPFIRDENGIPVLSDKLRINRYEVYMSDTPHMLSTITSPYYDTEVEEMVPLVVGEYILGELVYLTGNYSFSFGHDSEQANISFSTDEIWNMTISGIAYTGQYNKTSRRI